jgi:hypothetical protein
VDLLDKGEIESLVAVLRSLVCERPGLAEKLNTEAEYFERNAAKMRYPDFRAQGLFVGSGVIEAGCKTVIGSVSSSPECSGQFKEPAGVALMLDKSP